MKTSKLLFLLTLVLSLNFNVMIAQDEVSQREVIALLELKAKTKGHLWIHQWDQAKPITTWHGVTVKDGKVVGLDLSNNNLQGKIPLTIGNLKHLEHLDLSDNKIAGKMPKLFNKLQDLKTVDLAGNQLTGELPSSINKLRSLQELNLANNNLDGQLPASITELSKLTTLAVANNDFNGIMPDGMENMKKLKRLYIANNEFANLNNLKILAEQQLVFTDIDVNSSDYRAIDFTKSAEGLSKLKFEDDEDYDEK